MFYWLYTTLLVLGAAITLIPSFPLIKTALLSQMLNGILLPFVLVFMLLLANKQDLMGAYANSRAYNLIAWALTAVITALTVLMFFSL